MGEAKAVSERCLQPAHHRNSAWFTPLLANHIEDSERPPLHTAHWLVLSLPGRY